MSEEGCEVVFEVASGCVWLLWEKATTKPVRNVVLCMQLALTLTAREGSRSHTRTGHAIVALVTASDRTLPIVSVHRARQASRPRLLRQRGGEVAGRRRSAVRCSIASGTHAAALGTTRPAPAIFLPHLHPRMRTRSPITPRSRLSRSLELSVDRFRLSGGW